MASPWLRVVSCGGVRRPVADGQPHGVITKVGHQVEMPAERFDVSGDDVDGGHLTVFDL
jgi:hypothetical protein